MVASLHFKDNLFNNISAPNIVVPNKITARALTPSDFIGFKYARLRALLEEEHCFSSTYKKEFDLADEYWIDKCTPTDDSSFFGLFDGDEIVGIMYAEKWDRDPSGQTAHWGAAYVMPEYRGTGVSKHLYKARENWTKKHPHYKQCVFTLFDRNKQSAKIHKKRGAKYMFTETLKLPGRPDTPMHYYTRKINPKLTLIKSSRPKAPAPLPYMANQP